MYASEQKPHSDLNNNNKTLSYHSKEYIDILMLRILAAQSIQVTWLKGSKSSDVCTCSLLVAA